MTFLSFFKKEKIKRVMPSVLYMVGVPFYMLEITYMLSWAGSASARANQWLISPLLWGTIAIPAVLTFFINLWLKKRRAEKRNSKWEKEYPLVFIGLYSIYFFILSSFSFGKHYLTAGFSGTILIIFLLLLKQAQKEMFYLPPPKEFWFYFLTFIPPIAMLFSTDVYFLIMKESPYFILLAPVSYLPEIFGFWVFCMIRKHLFSKKRRGKLTLFHAIFVMQIFNVATSFYFGTFWGDRVIWISLTFGLASLLVAEKFSRYR